MSNQFPLILVNGIPDASISPLDRGFAYGDGLFETCRISTGRVPFWHFHRQRLLQGCRALKISLDNSLLDSQFAALLLETQVSSVTEGILKIIVTRGEGGRGYAPSLRVPPTICMLLYDGLPEVMQGITVRICQQRLACNPTLAGIKHLNRLEQILARSEWQDESYQEGLLLDANDHVIEATASNFFVVSNGQLATSDLSLSGVAGIMRQIILEQLASQLNIPVVVRDIFMVDVWSADEIFLCNSVKGIVSVARIVGEQDVTFQYGEVTRALQNRLSELLKTGYMQDEVS